MWASRGCDEESFEWGPLTPSSPIAPMSDVVGGGPAQKSNAHFVMSPYLSRHSNVIHWTNDFCHRLHRIHATSMTYSKYPVDDKFVWTTSPARDGAVCQIVAKEVLDFAAAAAMP